jgi:nicotinamide phosphoribosyltransferase
VNNNLFAPKSTDIAYARANDLKISLMLRADSYKLSHAFTYPDDIEGMATYIEARTSGDNVIIPFGMQMLVKRYLMQRITLLDIAVAKDFAARHGEPFSEEAWLYLVEEYDGAIPITLRAVPEGFPVRSGNALVSCVCVDKKLFWLAAYFETLILRGVWYPTTIATKDYEIKHDILRYYSLTGADAQMLPFSLHDFGGRGVSSAEQAEIGGAAHLVNFMGSDTMEGIAAANFYYKSDMAGFSVPATEHSVECSFGGGSEDALRYLRHVLKNLAKPGGIVSIVIDGYDVYREAELLCTTLRQEIIDCGAKVVFRPDSGDMMDVVPRLLRLQEAAFGVDINDAGFKKIRHVGILQGDGVDNLAIRMLLGRIMIMQYRADNIVFGSGGALLQKVNRDTYKFAQKASAVLRNVWIEDGDQGSGFVKKWVGIAKDPITDPGKKSKEGVLTLARSRMTGEVQTVRMENGLDGEFEDLMQVIYHNGVPYNETTMDEIRKRCALS